MPLALLKSKDKALNSFRKIKAAAEIEADLKMKVLRTDHDGEFTSKEFAKFCEDLGLKRFLTTHVLRSKTDCRKEEPD